MKMIATMPAGFHVAAFTLTELLFVIFFIGLVVYLIMPRFGSLQPSRTKDAKTQISMFETALDIFKVDNGYLPSGTNGLNDLVVRPSAATNWRQYMESIPLDPWGHPYAYKYLGANLSPAFEIVSAGQDGQFGTADDIRNLDAPAK